MSPKILFILKYRENQYEPAEYGDEDYSHTLFSSGLYNSAKFIVDMLTDKLNIKAKLVQAIDNNYIHRLVTEYNPTHIVIEALWVVPEKFDILIELNPDRKWIIRGHSEIPFLANEGIAIDWLVRYVKYENVSIAMNSKNSLKDLRSIVRSAYPEWSEEKVNKKVVYMPNYYPTHNRNRDKNVPVNDKELNIACFGAIRPLKNNLIQAVAAIDYADRLGKKLFFHINGTRNEQGGANNIKNIRALFEKTRHKLVEHPWMEHGEFLKVLAKMDVSMNVSFSESFNIIAADSIAAGTPLVCSKEIPWSSRFSHADPTSSESIVKTLGFVLNPFYKMCLVIQNLRNLRRYCNRSLKAWKYWVDSL